MLQRRIRARRCLCRPAFHGIGRIRHGCIHPKTITLTISSHLAILAGALAIEAAIGYPSALFRAVAHPVVWIGALIGALDQALNRPRQGFAVRRAAGVAALAVILAGSVIPAMAIAALLAHGPGRTSAVVVAILASTLLAQRSLHSHVRAVAAGLETFGLPAGRRAVSMIVGRNPEMLDESGVVRAAMESLAENFSDGVVAPAFWLALGGLPGIAAYKAVNTADSMIGHRTDRHRAFGWAAARLDDVVNLPASRLSALWLILAAALLPGASPRAGWRAVRRDARHHRSPNAGWPEAAMAGALGLRIGGPRVYGDQVADVAWMGDGRAELTPSDLRRALRLYTLACVLQWLAVLALIALIRAAR